MPINGLKYYVKKGLFIIAPFFSLMAYSQLPKEFDPDYDYPYFHEISIERGIQPALQQGNHDFLVAFTTSINTSWYISEKYGFKSGLMFTDDLECVKNYYSVPIYASYRSKLNNNLYIGGPINSLGELLFQLIFGILPRNFEVYAGPSFAYIEPNNNLATYKTNNLFYKKGYLVDRKFVASLDGGFKINYQAWRIGLLGSFTISHIFTQNFRYYNELQPNFKDQPTWFLKANVGLSFLF